MRPPEGEEKEGTEGKKGMRPPEGEEKEGTEGETQKAESNTASSPRPVPRAVTFSHSIGPMSSPPLGASKSLYQESRSVAECLPREDIRTHSPGSLRSHQAMPHNSASNSTDEPENWNESQVSSWLRTIGVKEQYINKLHDEEVDGRVLLTLKIDYLRKEIGMKSGPALLLINKRDKLVKGPDPTPGQQKTLSAPKSKKEINRKEQKSSQCLPEGNEGHPVDIVEGVLGEKQTGQEQSVCVLTSKEDCKPRPFDKEGIDFTYVRHRVLQPESGVFDLINPCHEYKSFVTAATLDRVRLQAKFAKEVLKFGTGCMNIRSNGTIQFGVMDSRDGAGYTHGEIIGVPVKEKDMYVDALDHIERSFTPSDSEHVRQCIRPPRFIEVIDRTSTEKRYVIEVDIVPSISIVNGRVYSVRLPNFKESANKIEYEKETIYRRVGSKTETVIDKDQSNFYHRVRDRDAQRKEAENGQSSHIYLDICQDLGRKLTKLVTSDKKFIEKEEWYKLVTNIFKSDGTLRKIQPITSQTTKLLPSLPRQCLLETRKEERMYSLEMLSINHCDETSEEFIKAEKANVECQFYHGGRVAWLNFWLAEQRHVGEVIERDAYCDSSKLLSDTLKRNTDQSSVISFNIFHHPGSGGSTVARQLLWNKRKDLRCAVVKPSYPASVVTQHAVQLREYEEKDFQKCLPVLLLIEDADIEYLDDLRNELEVAIRTKQVHQGTVCFILLSCRRSHDPEKKCKESPESPNVSVTHKFSFEEKRKFAGKRQILEGQYQPEFILTFVLMSEEFNDKKISAYVERFVTHSLQGIDPDPENVVTRLFLYVAMLNTYVENSFISQSHCEALLALTFHMDRFRRHTFEKYLSEQAKLVFIHLRDEKTYIESIRIIHPKVAKEILQQLLGDQKSQSSLAMDLLHEKVLFEHRFGKEEYLGFLRALFLRRCRKSKGDETDSFFSPLIEHVCKTEHPEKAITLLTEAYQSFQKDAFFAQQLARLHYTHNKFEEAKDWAEKAAKRMPNNPTILHTKGQVLWKWFNAKCKAIEKVPKTAENTADAVDTALKAMECFRECEKAADKDPGTMNSSGYYAEVEVGCCLLKLISSLDVFSNTHNGHSEYMKYLVTEYIPADVNDHWERFHDHLKSLQKTMQVALEWISEELSYFQTDISADEEDNIVRSEMKINNPLPWLGKKSSEYGKYLSEATISIAMKQYQSNPASLTPFMKRMLIHHLGGGNTTSILSKLTELKESDAVRLFETVLSFYPRNPLKAKLDQRDLVNYMVTHLALKCLSPQSQKVAALNDLQALSRQFPTEKKRCCPSALFLLTLLFWPEDHDTHHERETKYEIVQTAVEHLKREYWTKMKDIPVRKRRIYTHFFLTNGSGLDKIVHKSKVETITKMLSVSEKRMKWYSGEVWKMPEIARMLKCVSGWTEDGKVYLEGPKKKKFSILPLYVLSVPPGNENITFYLGFTFRGPVALNIQVQNAVKK